MPYKVAAGRTLFASKNYQAKVLDMFGSSIVAFWPQNESGGTVSRDIGGRGLNGTYTGVTLRAQGIGDGETAASFDGTTSYNNIYSAGLNGAFNGQELTIISWIYPTASLWTDGATRVAFRLVVDGNNQTQISRSVANNRLQFLYNSGAGANNKTINIDALSFVIPTAVCITASKSLDQFRAYVGGTQRGATTTGLGTWSGNLLTTTCCIGASSTVPAFVWSGTIGPVLLLSRAATAGEIAAASTL